MFLLEYPWKQCLCVVGAAAATGVLVGAATDSANTWEVGAAFHDHRLFAGERAGHLHMCLVADARRIDAQDPKSQTVTEEQRHV